MALGYPEQAAVAAEEAMAIARNGRKPVSIAVAYVAEVALAVQYPESDGVETLLQEASAHAEDHGLPLFQNWFAFFGAAIQLRLGHAADALPRMQAAITTADDRLSRKFRPFQLGCLAEAHLQLGNAEQALAMIDAAIVTGEITGEKQSEVSLYRIEGGCSPGSGAVNRSSPADPAGVEDRPPAEGKGGDRARCAGYGRMRNMTRSTRIAPAPRWPRSMRNWKRASTGRMCVRPRPRWTAPAPRAAHALLRRLALNRRRRFHRRAGRSAPEMTPSSPIPTMPAWPISVIEGADDFDIMAGGASAADKFGRKPAFQLQIRRIAAPGAPEQPARRGHGLLHVGAEQHMAGKDRGLRLRLAVAAHRAIGEHAPIGEAGQRRIERMHGHAAGFQPVRRRRQDRSSRRDSARRTPVSGTTTPLPNSQNMLWI